MQLDLDFMFKRNYAREKLSGHFFFLQKNNNVKARDNSCLTIMNN